MIIETPQFRKKSIEDQAKIKSIAIAKLDFSKGFENLTYGVEIEVQGVKDIRGGVEIMFKGWKNGKQLGFGKDGSVEIERLRMWNPPVLVYEDTTKDAIDILTGETIQVRNKREDPAQALRDRVAYVFNTIGKDFGNITPNKIGNTSSTFNPASGANSPVDGVTTETGDGTPSWSQIRDLATGDFATTTGGDNSSIAQVTTHSNLNVWNVFVRAAITFNTAALPDGDTIDSATMGIYMLSITNQLDGTGEIAMIDTNLNSDADVTTADYTIGVEIGTTKQATNLTLAGVTTGQINNFTLNATGLGNINKTGISKFGIIIESDRANIEPTYTASEGYEMRGSLADGTSGDPILTVEHSAAIVDTGNMFMMFD